MVPDRIEGRAMARFTGFLHKKKMLAGGKPVLPVFGTLTLVLRNYLLYQPRNGEDGKKDLFSYVKMFPLENTKNILA